MCHTKALGGNTVIEKLEYIENVMKKIDEEIKLNGKKYDDIADAYEELFDQAMVDEDYAKALGLRLRILDIKSEKNDNGFNFDNLRDYPIILDLYIMLELYEEAYDFCKKTFDKEYDLSDGYVFNELIHVYKYIPCLCYKLQLEDEYEVASKELYRLSKVLADEELDGDLGYLGEVYFSGGKVYVLLNEYEKALECYRKARAYYFRAKEAFEEKGLLTPNLITVLNNLFIDYCEAMIEVAVLTNNDENVKRFEHKKLNIDEYNWAKAKR